MTSQDTSTPPATTHHEATDMDTTAITTQTEVTQPLPLPEPPSHHEDVENATTTLDISSGAGSVRLDHLGPLVVHLNGTVSRVANWAEMTDIERQNTLTVLGKRNKLRLANLRQSLVDGAEKTD